MVLLTVGVLNFYGCSVLGLLIGKSYEKKTQTVEMLPQPPPLVIEELKKNKKVLLYLKDGREIKGTFKKAEVVEGEAFSITLKDSTDTYYSYRVDGIEQIGLISEKSKNKKGRLIGFLVGLTIDVIVVAGAMVAMQDMFSGISLSSGNSSCPYFYSYDGSQYILEAEPYSGSFYPAAQRSDWDRLAHLQADDGLYRMRITNELPETQYIDNVQLCVVDHPQGTVVYPDLEGRFYQFSTLQAPMSAADKQGSNLLNLIRPGDGNFWLSNPFSRDPANPDDQRDYLELSFRRPAPARQAQLLFRVQKTPWSSYMFREMLTRQGKELPKFFAELEHSADLQANLEGALTREGALMVKLWDGARWVNAGHFVNVGPLVAKTLVVPLDLGRVRGERLRLRLEVPPGVWHVYSVEASFGAPQFAEANILPAQTVSDQEGRDLRSYLTAVDGKYLVMPDNDMVIDLRFQAPPPVPGRKRTVLLESNGYYFMHLPEATAEPSATIGQLLNEEGAYTAFTLQEFQRMLEAEKMRLASTSTSPVQ